MLSRTEALEQIGFNGAALRRARSGRYTLPELRAAIAASTGPRSGERGVRNQDSRCHRRRGRFNGAALRRARSDAGSRLPQGVAGFASTGPRSGERGVTARRRRRRWRKCFNGAALRRARSAACNAPTVRTRGASTGPRSGERGVRAVACRSCRNRRASTGPRSGERGVGNAVRAYCLGCICFNGAALRRARSGAQAGWAW